MMDCGDRGFFLFVLYELGCLWDANEYLRTDRHPDECTQTERKDFLTSLWPDLKDYVRGTFVGCAYAR